MDEEKATTMKDSDTFRENAENCLQLAETTTDETKAKRYRRMAEAWRALADEQDWLDGEVPAQPNNRTPKRESEQKVYRR